MSSKFSILMMQQALALAKSRRGFCAPNPAVGSVIVREEKIIAEGVHLGAGHPHAEIEALKKLGDRAKGATLYVTLEPCCHFGRTPPCTDQIIQSGIARVYFGLVDPNPKVAGQGKAALEKAGIPCELIDLPEIRKFYQSYIYWTQQHRPFVTAKLAVSWDGKIAGPDGIPVQLTSEKAQRKTHEYRHRMDAILTGIHTILKDDPQLNVRLGLEVLAKPIYILDSQLRLPLMAKVIQTAKTLTVFHASNVNSERKKALMALGVRCEEVPSTSKGLDLPTILTIIGRDGMQDLWIEAGPQVFESFHEQQLLGRILIYISPKTLGQTAMPAFRKPLALRNAFIKWGRLGPDLLLEISASV